MYFNLYRKKRTFYNIFPVMLRIYPSIYYKVFKSTRYTFRWLSKYHTSNDGSSLCGGFVRGWQLYYILDSCTTLLAVSTHPFHCYINFISPKCHCAFNRHHDRFGVNRPRLASKIPTFAGIFHQSQCLYVIFMFK